MAVLDWNRIGAFRKCQVGRSLHYRNHWRVDYQPIVVTVGGSSSHTKHLAVSFHLACRLPDRGAHCSVHVYVPDPFLASRKQWRWRWLYECTFPNDLGTFFAGLASM